MRQLELYKYNPAQCSPEELDATFVARQGVLDMILDDLRARVSAPVNQHFLVTGPRGIGKTNLLLLIRHAVTADRALSAAYVAIQTAEEEYSISSLRDFFGKALSLLVEVEPDESLEKSVESVDCTDDDEQAADIAIGALKGFCQRAGRKILLLVDNLDLILGDQLTDDAQIGRLRDVLMNDSFLVLVGAAPTHFKEVSGYDRPFYNFFKPIDLEDLSAEQTAHLLRKRAEWDDNRAILDRFEELKPRLNAVHHLAGGNPRLALMLYQLYTGTELPEVRAALQMLLDDLTPYYKARLERLAPQQRKVMDTFARLGRPATPTELAAEARLPVNQINSILNRLRELGFVSVPPQKRRKTTLYIVSERVFRIWHQMRFSTAGRRRLQFLVQFIRIWYSAQEWAAEADRLMGEYRSAASEKRFAEAGRFIEHLEYLAEAAPRDELRYRVSDHVVRACIESRDFERAEGILLDRIPGYTRERNSDRLAESWYLMAYLRNAQGRTADETNALEKALQFRPDFHQALSNWGAALQGLALTKTGADSGRLFAQAIEKYGAAVKVKPDMHDALYNWGSALRDLAVAKTGADRERLLAQAIEKYDAAVKVKPDMHEALNNWGVALRHLAVAKTGADRDGLLAQAIEKYDAALKVKPDGHQVLYNWGNTLKDLALTNTGPDRDRGLAQAIEKYDAALKVKPDMHEALNNWGTALRHLALAKTGTDRDRLFKAASHKVSLAVDAAASQNAQEDVAFHSAHFVRLSLLRCALAVEADNAGHARSFFAAALDRVPQAEAELADAALVNFFRGVSSEQASALCAELLDAMRARNMAHALGVLQPFQAAVEYWQKGRDAEVLDRLNPEVRELVEAIISGPVRRSENARG